MSYTWKLVETITDYYYSFGYRHEYRYSDYCLYGLGYENVIEFIDDETVLKGTLHTPYNTWAGMNIYGYGEMTGSFYEQSGYREWDAGLGIYVFKIYRKDIDGTVIDITTIGKLAGTYGAGGYGVYGGWKITSLHEISSTKLLIIGQLTASYTTIWAVVTIGATTANATGIAYSPGYFRRQKNYNDEIHWQNTNLYDCYWNGSAIVITTNDGLIHSLNYNGEIDLNNQASSEDSYINYVVDWDYTTEYMQPLSAYPYSGTYNFQTPAITVNEVSRGDTVLGPASNVFHNDLPIIATRFGRIFLYNNGSYAPLFDTSDWDQGNCDFIAWNSSLMNPPFYFNLVRYFPSSGNVYGYAINADDSTIAVWKYTLTPKMSVGKHTIAAHKA